MKRYRNKGFTLVEVLICVGIIGIIAAITIPALISSTSEKALEVQKKALLSRMSQAFAQTKSINLFLENGYGSAARGFVADELSAVYKMKGICRPDQIDACGVPSVVEDFYDDTNTYPYQISGKNQTYKLNTLIPESTYWTTQPVVAFKTANGESILMSVNPYCKSRSDSEHDIAESVCVNMIYDLNGKAKAPNVYGEDIGFITVFYPDDPIVVAPILYNKEKFSGTYQQMLAKANEKNLVPPTIEELVAILINAEMMYITSHGDDIDSLHWSNSYPVSSSTTDKVMVAGITDGVKIQSTTTSSLPYYLIRK